MIELIATGTALLLFYFFFFYKINWVQDLTKHYNKSTSLYAKYKVMKNREIGQLPPVYPNGWFGLLESSTLKKGQIEHVAAIGQNFALFRTENGIVRIMDAYCPHLGANMAEGGEVKGEELECQFHLWRFCGESGKCTSIPYSKNVPASIKTKVWDCVETNGMIFVWYHAESASPDWYPQKIENISNGKWKYQGRNEFCINCHIQEIPENGADLAHLNAVHGSSIIPQDFFSKIFYHNWTDTSWEMKCSLKDSDSLLNHSDEEKSVNEKHIAISRLTHNLICFNKFAIMKLEVEATQIGPGYVELNLKTAFGPLCVIQTTTPLQPLLQKVTHLFYAPLVAAPYSRIILIGKTIMFQRDVEIWNHKKYVENPILVSEDKKIKTFRRWYKQFYSENSPTYETCKDALDW